MDAYISKPVQSRDLLLLIDEQRKDRHPRNLVSA
jgi:hypothetical protein